MALLGALFFAGCSDNQKSGSAVEDTAQAKAGRKASMEGMKGIMEKKKGQSTR